MADDKKTPPAPKYTPGPDDPKLYNVIRIWDVYVLARSAEEAQKCLDHWVRNEGLTPSEATALPVTREPEVRERWREEKPLVADDITDDEFDKIAKGNTTITVFKTLYKKAVN